MFSLKAKTPAPGYTSPAHSDAIAIHAVLDRATATLAPFRAEVSRENAINQIVEDAIFGLIGDLNSRHPDLRAAAVSLHGNLPKWNAIAARLATEADRLDQEIIVAATAIRKQVRDGAAARLDGYFSPEPLDQAVSLTRAVHELETKLAPFNLSLRGQLGTTVVRAARMFLWSAESAVPKVLRILDGAASDRAAILKLAEEYRAKAAA